RRRHTIFSRDWSSDVCSSDLLPDKKTAVQKQFDAIRWQHDCPVFVELGPAHAPFPPGRDGGEGAGLSRADRPLQVLQEYLPRYLALNAQIRYFPAPAIKEEKRRWAEQLLLGHPGPLGRGVVGHIQLDAHQVIQPGAANNGLIEDVALHHLAADAPVGGQLDDGRLTAGTGLLQELLELFDLGNALEVAGRLHSRRDTRSTQGLQRTQGIACP